MVSVRLATPDDARSWLRLRQELWPDSSEPKHGEEIAHFFAGELSEPLAVLLAVDPSGRAIGLVELSIRAYATGCTSGRVAYLEGWFVVPEARGRGVGRALITAAEEWGRSQRCTELASDTEPDNQVGATAHRVLGFEDVGLVRCFRKDL